MLTGFIVSFNAILLNIKYDIHPIIIIYFNNFCFDFLSTNFCRLIEGKKIFKPGYDHIHFYINKKIKNNLFFNFIFFTTNIVIAIFAFYLFQYLNSLSMFIFYIILFLIYMRFMITIRKENKKQK